ncbi:MAG: citrate lyase subunit alpha [Candidatus Thermoplasmatota archaeon]|nr:citrate lyase subunit alpha [Candidatus Thermoplasmatota archaeon]
MYLKNKIELKSNGIGRYVPLCYGGGMHSPYIDHKGSIPSRVSEIGRVTRRRDPYESKMLPSIKEAIKKCGITDGMTISFHHHLRNGDKVVNMVIDELFRQGIKDIRIIPTALFDVHNRLIDHIKRGTITRIEGSLNGGLGRFISEGILEEPVILRSHSGRARAIQQGDIEIDVAFLGVSCCDPLGNANGLMGRSCYGPCGFLKADAKFAKKTVLITDELVNFPCIPISLPGTDVDHIVVVESIGDPSGIHTGTLKITDDPQRLTIANMILDVMDIGDVIRNGMSFQAGSGGISLALTKLLGDRLRKKDIKASFAVGGTTKYLVSLLEDGLIGYLIDGQSFDMESVRSLRDNPNHVEISVDQYANLHSGATFTEMEDVSFLSGTEVDTEFNVNVNTHSDGYLLHGIGGHQDVAYGSKLTFITVPLTRKGNPIIKDRVTTVTTPGKLVDIVVTEVGLAFNTTNVRKEVRQRNEDLESLCKKNGFNVMSIDELRRTSKASGMDILRKEGNKLVATIQYIDGTTLDSVWSVK